MNLKDAILIPALLIPVAPAIWMGFKGYGWYYAIVWGVFYVCFGVCEVVSSKRRGKTISQDIASTPSWVFWSIIGSWLILAGGLSAHWIMMRG